MNKLAITIAFVAIAASVAAANKLPTHRRPHIEHEGFEHESHHLEHPHHFDGEFEGEHEGRHTGFGHHRGGLEGHLEHESGHLEGGHHLHHEGNHHESGHLGGHHEGGHLSGHHEGGLRHHLRKPHHKLPVKPIKPRHGHRGQGAAGIGGAAGVGALGAFREHEAHAAGIEKSTRLGDRKSIEAKKGVAAGKKKHAEAGFHRNSENEDAGIHQHQVLNRNKVFIKDQTTGVNDVDGFRHSRGESEGGHIRGDESKFVKAGAGVKATHDSHLDRDVKAGVVGEESAEGVGAIGAGAIGGAGEVGF